MNDDRIKYVTFSDKKTEESFEKLILGKYEDKKLYEYIERAILDLKNNPICGVKIPKKIWPKEYMEKHHIDNFGNTIYQMHGD